MYITGKIDLGRRRLRDRSRSPFEPSAPMFTSEQYRAKAAQYDALLEGGTPLEKAE